MSNLSQFLGGSSPKVSEFTTGGTFTKPSNVSWVHAFLMSGGAGGTGGNAYCDGGNNGGVGGGGGGACARRCRQG